MRRAGVEGAGDDARRLLAAALALSAAQILGPARAAAEPPRRPSASAAASPGAPRASPCRASWASGTSIGRSFAISPATLDPRPDSETLIEAALELAAAEGWTAEPARPLRILDVGTGSGCLLLTLLAELAARAGRRHGHEHGRVGRRARQCANGSGVARRAHWLAADALEAIRGPFDILISNPPYIPTSEIAGLDPEVRCYDPLLALDGGEDGLRFFHRLVAQMGSRRARWLGRARGGA